MAKQGIPIVLVPTSVVSHGLMGTIKDRNDAFRAAIRYYKRRNPLIVRRRHGRPFALLREVMRSARFSWKMWLKSLLFPRRTAARDLFAYYEFLGLRDALLNRTGKTIAPEDFLD